MLSQLGVVGTALFAAFIAAVVWLALRCRRRLDAISGGAIGAAIMVFAYWVLYGSQDWFWERPWRLPVWCWVSSASRGQPGDHRRGNPDHGLGRWRDEITSRKGSTTARMT